VKANFALLTEEFKEEQFKKKFFPYKARFVRKVIPLKEKVSTPAKHFRYSTPPLPFSSVDFAKQEEKEESAIVKDPPDKREKENAPPSSLPTDITFNKEQL
jgi:hypothetical protein